MAADVPSALAVQQQVAQLLADFSQPDALTASLVALVTLTEPASSLLLSTALNQLIGSTFSLDPSRPDPAQIAAYLHDSLFAAIGRGDGGEADEAKLERKAALADAIIDVAWQLDQQVDTQVPLMWRRANPPAPVEISAIQQPAAEKMEVDAAEPKVDNLEAEKTRQAAAVVEEARQRLAQIVKQLVQSGDLPREAVLERLELPFIRFLGILPDPNFFQRLEVRQRTALYYKQQKFNLLREESEGYSKLVVELLGSMGPPLSPLYASSQESEAARMKRARSVNDRVKNLIGNFDLDPSRTLDVLLDTFSDHVVEHWQFFLDVLAVSPWAPKQLGQAAKSSANLDKGKGKGKAVLVDVGLESDEGSDTIAQILGFKYAYYQGDEAPDVPANLHTTTALLIWHGYVKLTDLWAHLSPTDEDLAKLETKWRDEQAQLARSVGGANALAMAGALVDDEAPAAKPAASTPVNGTASTSAAPPPPPRDLPNQKVGLLRALLTIGDITHAFFILGQFPFLASAFPDIADLLNRLAHVSIDPAYASTSISRQHAQYADEFKAAKPKVTVDSKGEKKVTMPERKLALTSDAFPDPRRDWTFFFPRWQERVPRAGDWAGVVHLLEEMYLPLVKVFVARDFKLFTKLIRIAVADLAVDFANHPRRVNWLDLLRVHLVPAVSLLDSFTAASLELWRVLSLYPIETRFEIYGEWKDVHYRRNPVLGVRKAEAERDVKSLLRRLSTDNVKKLGKSFARIAHTNPAVIFAVALNQVQSYDNLIIPVVEACRYLTDLGYDIMAYSILDALSASKPKTKEDGTSIAMWLQGLATFTGHVYRRWIVMAPSLWVILQYLVNQLVSGNSKDLVVLRELIGRMTGFEPFADLSDAQVSSLAGGKYLRNEVFQKTDIAKASARGQQDGLVKAKNRLASSILDKGLAIPLAVNIALQRQACLKTDAHLKSLSSLFDQNHAILFQFNELLQAITTPDQLAELVPSVTDLLGRFKLDAGVAFDLARPRLRRALREYDEKEAADLAAEAAKKKQGLLAKLAKEKEKASPTPTDASAPAEGDDVKMGDVKEEGEQEESGTPPPPDAKVAMNGAVNDDAAMLDAVTAEVSLAPSKVPWHPGLVQIIQDVTELMPDGARKSIGAPFFTTFWQLALYDILYPKERYDAEIGRLKLLQREASASTALKPDDRRFFIDGVMTIANGLVEEAAKHMNARSTVNRRLTREKAQWFSDVSTTGQRQQLVHDILQYCLIPRSRLSLPDAVFSHQMIKRLHSMNTPQFHTIVLYDSLLTTQISPILYSCTENEARNFGRFLFDILADLYRWHKDKSAYVEEAANPQTSGFLRSMASTQAGEAGRVRGYYDHAEYQRAVLKWHTTMVQGFIDSFKSDEYMHIKNSILVLTKIAPYFPLDYTVGEKLERAVSELVVVEKREDLQILAQGYKAVISKRRPQWLNQPKTETTPVPPAPKPASATASPAVTPAASSKTSPDPAPAPARSSDTSRVPTGPKSSLPSRPGMRTADSDIKPPTGPAAT
ncbi:tho2 protein [Rhodotorula toruloides]|uniref:THO complex subunit 2 n=1 Tax=Rhodotorula toruloides TaxID=5286 RepID=A0A511KN96_RHOTO|nr:tho2 protein [Rhodotorula toruloides]